MLKFLLGLIAGTVGRDGFLRLYESATVFPYQDRMHAIYMAARGCKFPTSHTGDRCNCANDYKEKVR